MNKNVYIEKDNHVELHVRYKGQEKIFLLNKEDAKKAKEIGNWNYCPYTGREDLRCQKRKGNKRLSYFLKNLLGVKDRKTFDLTSPNVKINITMDNKNDSPIKAYMMVITSEQIRQLNDFIKDKKDGFVILNQVIYKDKAETDVYLNGAKIQLDNIILKR